MDLSLFACIVVAWVENSSDWLTEIKWKQTQAVVQALEHVEIPTGGA